jgi:hypothetical protein
MGNIKVKIELTSSDENIKDQYPIEEDFDVVLAFHKVQQTLA